MGMSYYTDLIPVTTERYNAKFDGRKIAIRPRYSVLSNELLTSRNIVMPDWKYDFIRFVEKQRTSFLGDI
jgi:hypothetical protein